MTTRIHLGLSTCPNDTYLAHALLTGAIETPGIELDIELLDVQTLNERLIQGHFDVAKASYHLALRLADELIVLPTGSAVGFGNGPLLLARPELTGQLPGPDSKVLCPGEDTTAALLYKIFHPKGAEPRQVVFSEIMPALIAGDADFGVCIHEGRFTYEESGLICIEDLGASWEGSASSPLPLGGLFARRGLDERTIDAVQSAMHASLLYADSHREETLPTMRASAQELEEAVIWSHVDLYVNGWTRILGPQGERAIRRLTQRAEDVGAIPPGKRLEVFRPLQGRRVFHLIPSGLIATFEAASKGPGRTYEPPAYADEGFIHLSQGPQLAGTLDLHFRGVDEVLLVALDASALGTDLRWETSRGGALFPHLYRRLRPALDMQASWRLTRAESGAFEVPQEATLARD